MRRWFEVIDVSRWGGTIKRRIEFSFPGGHGSTFVERLTPGTRGDPRGRRRRHLSLWFGQSREDVNRYIGPRYTLSIDLYREPKSKRRRV